MSIATGITAGLVSSLTLDINPPNGRCKFESLQSASPAQFLDLVDDVSSAVVSTAGITFRS
jgi:hypothetical protein